MPGRWRDEFTAGRAAVRAAATGRPPPRTVTVATAPGGAGEAAYWRGLAGELREVAEQLQAEADCYAAALDVPGGRKALLGTVHPDAHLGADETKLRTLTAARGKIEAAYELRGRAKQQQP